MLLLYLGDAGLVGHSPEHDQMSSLDMTVASGSVDRMMQMGMCVRAGE